MEVCSLDKPEMLMWVFILVKFFLKVVMKQEVLVWMLLASFSSSFFSCVLDDLFGSILLNIFLLLDTTDIHSSGKLQILESGSLLIASAESSDVGKYTCIRENSAGSVKGYAYLAVLVRTQIIQPPADTKSYTEF
ncbi:protein sidekick [Caerostris extrusa]|uniref:Protein sidekick n=1 Tax=Caerostris extrusa TaxID=172846 RepID=A0AAV4SGW9_CAEEX|nr:protein sidekick [Caerostris extrusa]